MNKKVFAFIIATSIVAFPITAQEIENTSESKQAYNAGLKMGVAGTLVASTFAMLAYIASTMKEGLYIPAKINCKKVFHGYEWKSNCYNHRNKSHSSCCYEPKYEIVCDPNPLFDTLNDISGSCSIKGAEIDVHNDMIQKIDNFMPNVFLVGCICTLFGAICYYTQLDEKSTSEEKTQ